MYLRRSSISPKSLAPPTRSMPRKLIRLRRSRNWVAQISHFAWPFHQKHLNRPSDLFVVVEPPCSSGFPLNVRVDARHRATTVQRRKKLRTKCRIRFQVEKIPVRQQTRPRIENLQTRKRQWPWKGLLCRETSAKGSLSRTAKVGNGFSPLFYFNPSSFRTGRSWPAA